MASINHPYVYSRQNDFGFGPNLNLRVPAFKPVTSPFSNYKPPVSFAQNIPTVNNQPPARLRFLAKSAETKEPMPKPQEIKQPLTNDAKEYLNDLSGVELLAMREELLSDRKELRHKLFFNANNLEIVESAISKKAVESVVLVSNKTKATVDLNVQAQKKQKIDAELNPKTEQSVHFNFGNLDSAL